MTSESIVVVLFFAGFIGFTVGESLWLNRQKGVKGARAVALSALPNTICITVGFFGSFVIFGAILAMAFDGSLENLTGHNVNVWAVITAVLLFPFLLLIFTKWLLGRLFKLDSITGPLGFAVASSLIFFIATLVGPALYIAFFKG